MAQRANESLAEPRQRHFLEAILAILKSPKLL
jgi:hypothetical protein